MKVSFLSIDDENNKINFSTEVTKVDNKYIFIDKTTPNTTIEIEVLGECIRLVRTGDTTMYMLYDLKNITSGSYENKEGLEFFLKGYEKLHGLDICIHIINGLPGETREMMLETAAELARLHPKFIKFHLLHVISGTSMCRDYLAGGFETISREEYVDTVVSQLELLPPDTVIERLTGDGAEKDLVSPLWSKKKLVVMNEIDKEFVRRSSMQGSKWENPK